MCESAIRDDASLTRWMQSKTDRRVSWFCRCVVGCFARRCSTTTHCCWHAADRRILLLLLLLLTMMRAWAACWRNCWRPHPMCCSAARTDTCSSETQLQLQGYTLQQRSQRKHAHTTNQLFLRIAGSTLGRFAIKLFLLGWATDCLRTGKLAR